MGGTACVRRVTTSSHRKCVGGWWQACVSEQTGCALSHGATPWTGHQPVGPAWPIRIHKRLQTACQVGPRTGDAMRRYRLPLSGQVAVMTLSSRGLRSRTRPLAFRPRLASRLGHASPVKNAEKRCPIQHPTCRHGAETGVASLISWDIRLPQLMILFTCSSSPGSSDSSLPTKSLVASNSSDNPSRSFSQTSAR